MPLFSDDFADGLIEDLFNGTIDPMNLPEDYYEKVANFISKAMNEGFKETLKDIGSKLGKTDEELLIALDENIFMFSAAKTFQQTLEMSDALVNENGDYRTREEFREEAKKIFTKYNGGYDEDGNELNGWLDAERNTAITQAGNAAKWNDIKKNKEVLPYLRYVAVGDADTCDICDPLDGITLPVDDSFWDQYSPANHFNCRCLLEQLDQQDGEQAESEDADIEAAQGESKLPDEFKYNPGKREEIYSTTGKSQHPYFSVPKEYKDFAKENFGLPLPE